jgi:hypothetical protein
VRFAVHFFCSSGCGPPCETAYQKIIFEVQKKWNKSIFNLPIEIKLAVQAEAERQMTTAAAYVRRAIAQALHADGISTKRGPHPRGSRPTQEHAA